MVETLFVSAPLTFSVFVLELKFLTQSTFISLLQIAMFPNYITEFIKWRQIQRVKYNLPNSRDKL